MGFRNKQSMVLLRQINSRAKVHFEDVTCDLDDRDTAVAEYDGVILQLLFPDPEKAYFGFNLLLTDITKAENTVFFKNGKGSEKLNISQVVRLVNEYIQRAEKVYLEHHKRG